MVYYIFDYQQIPIITLISIIFAFVLTCVAISMGKDILPRDAGRAFAVNGTKSVGKPRGAGIIFILVFVLTVVLFVPLNSELVIYMILTLAAMLTGYLDDSAEKPWGNLKKGILDFLIAGMTAFTYLNFNDTTVNLVLFKTTIDIPYVIYFILIIVLVWASINVTNCTDGVDGLCGSLSVITLMTIYGLFLLFNRDEFFGHTILLMAVCLLGYLWFNASPSKLLMGDAGSRAIGVFIAFAMLKSGSPFLYLLVAIVIIIDGGLGLIKVSLKRFLKISIMKNTRTPIHDHMRKNKEWSDAQVVFRFAIMQMFISVVTLYLAYILK